MSDSSSQTPGGLASLYNGNGRYFNSLAGTGKGPIFALGYIGGYWSANTLKKPGFFSSANP